MEPVEHPPWSTACPDWAERLVSGRSIIPPPIYPDQAAQALEIFKALRVVDLPGKPTFGECSEPWVFDFVAAVFGAYHEETGQQLIREYLLLISKKNTKSTIGAGIMLTALIICWRENEELLFLAPTKEIADNAFKPAAGMVAADEELRLIFHIQPHLRTITSRITGASLKVVAADTDTVSGKKAGRIMLDELWVFGGRSNADSMLMEATGGQVSRDEGWIIYLSTQSDQPPAGVFKDKLQYFRDVRDGVIEDKKSLGVLYEFPQEMVESKAYLLPENFHITNPNLNRSVSRVWLEDKLRQFLPKKDGTLQQFLAKHLNVEIGLALRSDRWVGANLWESCAVAAYTWDEFVARCEVVTAGIDGGGLDDMLGLAVLGREIETGRWLLWVHAWIYEIALERNMKDSPRLRDFATQGLLTIVPREEAGRDITDVCDKIEQLEKAGLLERIGVDPVGIGGITDELLSRGFKEDRIVGISQGYKLMGSINTTERKLLDRGMAHTNDPMMRWCVSNARVEQRGNAVLITKSASGKGKIDPLMATLNAVSLMSLNPAPKRRKLQMFVLGGTSKPA